MNRQVFFDRLLVSNEEFDLPELENLYEYLKGLESWEGYIDGDPTPEETGFTSYSSNHMYALEDLQKDNLPLDALFLRKIMSMDLIPVPADHMVELVMNAHEMEEGGGMAFHQDGTYSVAVTIYLNSVEGGAFQAKFEQSEDINSIIEILPKAGRAVIVKCDTLHRVTKVTKGIRKSIQIFIRYSHRNERDEIQLQDEALRASA